MGTNSSGVRPLDIDAAIPGRFIGFSLSPSPISELGLKDGVDKQADERRLFKNLFADSFRLKTFGLETAGPVGRSIRASFA
jgi:hypothetical protein